MQRADLEACSWNGFFFMFMSWALPRENNNKKIKKLNGAGGETGKEEGQCSRQQLKSNFFILMSFPIRGRDEKRMSILLKAGLVCFVVIWIRNKFRWALVGCQGECFLIGGRVADISPLLYLCLFYVVCMFKNDYRFSLLPGLTVQKPESQFSNATEKKWASSPAQCHCRGNSLSLLSLSTENFKAFILLVNPFPQCVYSEMLWFIFLCGRTEL